MTQKVTVKEVTIKKGTNDKGEWVNTRITGEDGAVFGTFHKGAAQIQKGDVIELDPIIKGKNINFEVWNMLEKSTGVAETLSGSNPPYRRDTEGIEFEYKLKAQLQEAERISIEAQTAYNGIIELVKESNAWKVDGFEALVKKAFKWTETRLDTSGPGAEKPIEKPPQKATEKVTAGADQEVDPEHPFPNVGALLTWCQTKGISRAQFFEITQTTEKLLPKVNIVDAHQVLLAYLKEH